MRNYCTYVTTALLLSAGLMLKHFKKLHSTPRRRRATDQTLRVGSRKTS